MGTEAWTISPFLHIVLYHLVLTYSCLASSVVCYFFFSLFFSLSRQRMSAGPPFRGREIDNNTPP